MSLQDPRPRCRASRRRPGDVDHATRVLDALKIESDGYLRRWISKISPIQILISDRPKSQWFF